MELNPLVFDEKLKKFLRAWKKSNVQNMTLENYANLNNHNSFCYWLEYGSPELGAIGNNSLNKFGIWVPKDDDKVFDEMFNYDGTYAWYAKLGHTSQEAFEKIHEKIKHVVELASTNRFAEIEHISLHSIVKWKIALLYSKKQLLPIFSRPALLQVSKGLGGNHEQKTPIFELQSYILSFKPPEEPLEAFAARVYSMYRIKDPKFYIIGSKYNDDSGGDTVDVLPDMLASSDVSIGFLNGLNFTPYLDHKPSDIERIISENYEEKSPSLYKLQRYFKLLLQIKEGDIIAVKSQGTHNKLTIVAYATVTKRNGTVYKYLPKALGHHIHVEFTDWGFKKNVGLTYAETIHEVKITNPHFKRIFGPYALLDDAIGENDPDNDENDGDESDYIRGAISQAIVKRIHYIMQKRFLKYLKNKYKGQTIEKEFKNRIDVYRTDGTFEWIYEIKPFESPYRCIREGIGQLLDYVHKFKSKPNYKIIIVGPEKPKATDEKFIYHIKNTLKIDFEYQCFDYQNNK